MYYALYKVFFLRKVERVIEKDEGHVAIERLL